MRYRGLEAVIGDAEGATGMLNVLKGGKRVTYRKRVLKRFSKC